MNSFIENVNYLASLDNNYGDGVVLNKSNLSLRNVANDITLKFSYFNYDTRQIETVTKGIQGMLYTGLEAALQEFVVQIKASLGGNKFDASYTISSSNTGFLIHSFSITINSLDEKLKCTEINFNAKITSTQFEIYNLYGNVTNPLKLLPTLALLDADTINDMDIIVENISSVNTVSDNIDDVVIVGNDITNVNTVANNTNNINTVSNDISNINNVGSNITSVNTVNVNISSVNNVSSISDDVVIASSISADISSVANIDDNVVIVADNISSVNTNANNIVDINSVATTVVPNINEILLVDDRAAQVALDTIAVENDRAEVALMKLAVENIYDAFDDRFLGTKTIDPIVDNDGNALLDGALYFNTSSNTLMVYDAVSLVWIMIPQIYLSALLDVELSSITTGDILNWNGTNWVNTRTPKVDSIQLNGGASTEGIISWNATEGTADLGLPGGSTLQIGQENVRTVRNATASTISNGRLCMFDGTIGNSGRIKVKPFTAGFNEAMYLYGVATQNIISGSDGIITIEGKVRGIDTTGASVGEVWADEDILYAKPNDNGMMTNIEPADNELKLVVATVIHAHATNGCLEIRFTPFNENMYYTKVQNDILLNSKVPLSGDFTLDLGGL